MGGGGGGGVDFGFVKEAALLGAAGAAATVSSDLSCRFTKREREGERERERERGREGEREREVVDTPWCGGGRREEGKGT